MLDHAHWKCWRGVTMDEGRVKSLMVGCRCVHVLLVCTTTAEGLRRILKWRDMSSGWKRWRGG